MRLGQKIGALTLAMVGALALASGDYFASPTWSLEKAEYDPAGSSAFLSPANDSRVNMLLLLADRRPAGLELQPAAKGAPLVLFPWDTLMARITPSVDEQAASAVAADYGRCQTNVSGTEEFTAAVNAAKRLPADEKASLIAARQGLTECSSPDARKAAPVTSPASDAGRAFAAYLAGTRAFYAGDFPTAQAAFAGLQGAGDAWLRETALYMVARTALNGAQATIFDEYGSILPPEKRDQRAVAAAGAAFEAYLKAYPRGRYAGSAQGLMRRVYWLAGDHARLSAAYDRIITADSAGSTAAGDAALVQEIDYKLFDSDPDNAPAAAPGVTGSVLLAVDDIKRMRNGGDPECCKPISAEEIEAQHASFGANTALFDYVRAAQAFFVRHDAAAVLRLLPDGPRHRRFTTLEFSRQMLRGLALDALKDANARQFWIGLLPGATGPYQREAVELAIATHDERNGALDRVFAPGSPVTNPILREVLLTYTAGPDLLRKQAQDKSVPQRERDVALYLLLAKGVQRGFYADFLRDVRLVPSGAPNDSSMSLNDGSADMAEYVTVPPTGLFARPLKLGDFGCPSLTTTVQVLAANPRANTPRICLAEFFRTNGFDHFAYDGPLEGKGLAGTQPLFPGAPYSRQTVYQAVIADPAASDNERAYALYRAVRCYAPSGNNDCGGKDVDVSQRRAWFRQLKTAYPKSHWATSSDLYW
jgi:hypothetical protein